MGSFDIMPRYLPATLEKDHQLCNFRYHNLFIFPDNNDNAEVETHWDTNSEKEKSYIT